MILDHLGIGVSHYEKSKAFYAAALEPLGIRLVTEISPEVNPGGAWAAGFGRDGDPQFWIGSDGKTTPPAHVAFRARSRAQVRAFHAAALAVGAANNGRPGLRTRYHASYYAAFVRDLDGHNLEAVFHGPGEE
jgi:catechol 2,3-dioxygenase-like lactoylglutathione lyase family enzyme